MGWDAHSSAKKNWGKKKLSDPEMDAVFLKADEFVLEKCGSRDGYLRMGGLDCSACREMLEQATGWDWYSTRGFNSEDIKHMNKNADWEFQFPKDQAWAYWSAKMFLESCAVCNLSVEISY